MKFTADDWAGDLNASFEHGVFVFTFQSCPPQVIKMKTLLPTSTGLILLLACLCASEASAQAWTAKAFPVTKHDFGTVAVGSKTEFRFPVHNPFQSEMSIQSIRTSCGCTTPTIETKTIQPGQQGSILAQFNTPTFRGKKGATLTVIINRPVFAEIRLRVDGYIRSDIVMHPGAVDFGQLPSAEKASESTLLMYAGRPDWQIIDIESADAWLKPSFVEEKRAGGSIHYRVSVNVDESAPAGFFQRELTIVTNDRAMPRVPLRVSGTIQEQLMVSPRTIAFGDVQQGAPVVQKLIIRADQAFTIETIQCEGWKVDFDAPAEAKKIHMIDARFTPQGGVGSTKVNVIVDAIGETRMQGQVVLTAEVADEPQATETKADPAAEDSIASIAE